MKAILMGIFLSLWLSMIPAWAQTLEQLAVTQQGKVEAALGRLNEQRKTIAEAQIPLVKELNALEAQVKTLQVDVNKQQAVRDSKSVSLELLKANVGEQSKAYDYISRTLFGEYFANYQAMLSAGEQATFNTPLLEHYLLLEQADVTETKRLTSALAMIDASLARVATLIGGKRYAGEALAADGKLVDGQFVQVGPLLYFAGQDQGQTGIVAESKTLQAKVHPLEKPLARAIATLAAEGHGELPVDPSLGDALALQQTRDSFGEHLRKGGIWVYPIMLFAFIATIVALGKCIQIFTLRHPAPLVVHDMVKLIREGNLSAAKALAARQPQPAAAMLVNAVEHADESVELVEEVMYESMLTTQPKLERFLNIIAVTAAIAPLLGLLGTVTGIIKTFNLMKVFGAGDPKPLISGISEALITTELGLVLAIPALIFHALLARKVAGAMAHLEKLAVAFVNGLSRKAVN